MVMIGIDPAKHSHAMAVLDDAERQLAALQVGNDNDGYRAMLRLARRWPQRTWAVEGASGVGTHLAQRLLADGESVLEVPPSWPPAPGSSTPDTAARTTPPTPGPSPSSAYAPTACARSCPTVTGWR